MSYQDLLKDVSESKDDGNYFLVTITDLDLGTAYPLQFRWKNKNGTLGAWSSVKTFTTAYATIPSEPNLGSGDVVGGAGFIKVTWDGNNALSAAASNFDRVNVHISGSPFGDGTKPSGFFKQAGTQTFSAPPGVYIVQLKILTVNGAESLYSTARTVTVTAATPTPESSVTPSTPTVSSVLGAIQLSWNGKTSTGADQPFGFNAAKVYVGTSAGFTPSSSNQVDVLNFANGQNTLNIGVGTIVNSVALTYGIDYYIKIATTNGTDTSTAVSATGNPVRIGQVTSGDIVTITADKIATGVLSAGSKITAGAAGGKRVELNGTGDTPFAIYGTGGTKIFDYNSTSNKLTIVGDGTFTGDISGATGTLTNALNVGTISGGLYPFSVSSSGVMRAISGTIGGLTLAADAIQNTGNTFRLDSSGIIRAGSSTGNSVIISPSLGIYHSADGGSTASGRFTLGLSSSTISGWTIGTSTLSSGNLTLNSNGTITTTNLTIYDTGRILNSGGFEVTSAGKLIATGADVSGTVTAEVGRIGGWYIGSTYLSNINNVNGDYYMNSSNGNIAMNSVIFRQSAGSNGIDLTNGSDLRMRGGTIYLGTGGSIDASLASIKIGAGDIIDSSGNIKAWGNITSTGSATFGTTNTFEYLSSSGTLRSLYTYNVQRSASTRPLIIDNNGNFGTASSTRRRKHEIESYRINSSSLLELDVKTFKYNIDIDPDQSTQYGFIAEDAQDLGLNELIQLDTEGVPEYFAYDKLPIFLLQIIQDQDASIKSMKLRLDALEG